MRRHGRRRLERRIRKRSVVGVWQTDNGVVGAGAGTAEKRSGDELQWTEPVARSSAGA